MKEFVLNEKKLKKEYVEIENIINNSNLQISYTILEKILFDKKNYNKLIKYLNNNSLQEFRIFNNFDLLLKISKLSFLDACLLYLKKNGYENNNMYLELSNIVSNLDYSKFINPKEYHKIIIDNKEYKILSYSYFELLKSNSFEEILTKKHFHDIPIKCFIYGLVNYFENNNLLSKYYFPSIVVKRYLDLKNNKLIDYQSINKILTTKDRLQKKVRISRDVYDVISKRYDKDLLKNIIKCYIELCKMFSYDEKYFIDPESDESKKHLRVEYLPHVNKKNNKIVCYEFSEIFGMFLNMNNIKYEIIGKNDNYYGMNHNHLVFRYDDFLIKVDPINTVYKTDFVNTKTNFPLVGITCINKNEETKKQFQNIINNCYQFEEIDLNNDYLPNNKFENDNQIDLSLTNYLIKIDLLLKKINDLKLEPMEKVGYFKQLIKNIFTQEELEKNVFYAIVSNYISLVYIIILNPDLNKTSDTVYLIYQNGKLSFIELNELRYLFENKSLFKFGSREIPGIDSIEKRR